MGEFVAVTAFRAEDASAVVDAARRYFAEHRWPVATAEGAATEDDLVVFAPVQGWTVVVWPGYFTDVPAAAFMSEALAAKYAGHSQVVAEAVGVPAEAIAPYLVQMPPVEFDDDAGEVFVDFWRRLGIAYPDGSNAPVARLRLAPGWLGNLPGRDVEL